MLGTFVEICAGGTRKDKLFCAINEAFKAIALIHRLMSFHDETSDVSRINRLALRHLVSIHPLTYEVLKTAQKISIQTDGLFDCTVATHLVRLKYLPPIVSARNKPSGNFKDIHFFPSQKIKFRKPLSIDLGGIAKGFAVDMAVRKLKASGIPYGSVNAGGDLRIFGNTKQPIHIRSAEHPGKIFLLGYVEEGALATSASYFSRKRFKKTWVTPIINPKDGSAHVGLASASVFAPSCMMADALTKAVMLSGNPRASFLKKFSARAFMFEHSSRN